MMQRTQVQDQEKSLEREKRINYKGSARIRLEHYDFSEDGPGVLDKSVVKNLVSIFEREGCFHQDMRHHVPAVIEREQLDLALQSSGVPSDVLLGNAQTESPEIDDQEQSKEPTQEYVDQGYALQEQPNAEETREDQDQRQAETNEQQEGLNSGDTSEWQNYMEQLGGTNHLFDSPPRSQSVQRNQTPQSMDDVDEPVTYDREGEWGSVAPSIISSSYYSDNVPLEGDPLEERAPPKETPLRAIASAHTEATEEEERFKFIYRDGDDWIPMEEYRFGPSLFSSVELIANKHAGEGRCLFDTTLWSLHPSECFEAAMAHGSHPCLSNRKNSY
ncbi:MAG: hypothetical protein Q9195_005200 [Heterodermia aff. obscurata]